MQNTTVKALPVIDKGTTVKPLLPVNSYLFKVYRLSDDRHTLVAYETYVRDVYGSLENCIGSLALGVGPSIRKIEVTGHVGMDGNLVRF